MNMCKKCDTEIGAALAILDKHKEMSNDIEDFNLIKTQA